MKRVMTGMQEDVAQIAWASILDGNAQFKVTKDTHYVKLYVGMD